MRKLQLVLAAGVASALTALAMVVGMAEAQPAVPPSNTENPAVVGTAQDGRGARRQETASGPAPTR